MPILNPFILAPLLLILFLAAGTLVWAALWGIGVWKKKRWAKWTGGVGLGVSLVLITLVGGCYMWMWSPVKNPQRVFQAAFGKPPPPGVTNIVGESSGFGDSAGIVIRFSCDDATFRALLPTVIGKISEAEWSQYESSHAHGRDWPNLTGDGIEHYLHEHSVESRKLGPRGFSSEVYAIARNPRTGEVQFYWDGID